MGCCQTFQPEKSGEMAKELTDLPQAEFESNVIDLEDMKSSTPHQVVKKDVESINKKEFIYPKETRDRPDEESKKVQETPNDIKWSIKQSMFVKINSQKNVSQYYLIKELIGQGGFGKVYRVLHRQTGMVRAMKQIHKQKMNKEDQQLLLQETQLLMDIDHPNVVKLYEMYQDDHSYYLISEYCEGGELFDKIKMVQILTEKEIASYMKQILSAIAYCHSMNVVHRDLKPENILFDAKHQGATLKVIDFGASTKIENQEKLSKKIGTPYYVAPEVLQGRYDEKCDIWSLGVILYVLLCGYPPFFGHNESDVLQKVRKGVYQFDSQDWAKVSLQAKDLIRKMLFYNPGQRITAAEALQHPWITNNKSKNQINNLNLKKLQDFDSKNKLKYAILQFITVQVVSSKEKEELQNTFQEIDKNGDGTVSKEELLTAYIKLYKGDQIAAQQIVDELFPHLDANGSGKVDFSEFITASINKDKSLGRKKIEQSFKLFDLDGNGYITKLEINELFGDEIDEAMWKEILLECDTNQDGMISLSEFINLLENKFKAKQN